MEGFGTKLLTENYTRLGTCINHQLLMAGVGIIVHKLFQEKIKFFFGLFTVILGDLEGAGIFNPPSSYIQKPPTIRVKSLQKSPFHSHGL